jgi:hypothetical protein
MARRLARSLAVTVTLAALVAAGGACRKTGENTAAAPRSIAAVWADILGQRDAMHELMTKALEDVTHEDCAQVGAGARQLESLMNELTASVASDKSQTEGHLRALGEILGLVGQTVTKIRETALAEMPGAWPKLRFPLDQSLRDVETFASRRIRSNCAGSTGMTESRDCVTSFSVASARSALIVSSETGDSSAATGSSSTASQRGSSAVGSGNAFRRTRATPTTSAACEW